MSQQQRWQQRLLSLLGWLKRFRYVKFGLVGATGTVVNMLVLYLAQEYFFSAIGAPRIRLYVSLALAIMIATVNNFTWNRLWTWSDRRPTAPARLADRNNADPGALTVRAAQFGRYVLASWFGIAVQYGLTLWLSHSLHYLLANVIAIVIASVANFLANDRWTFRQHPAP